MDNPPREVLIPVEQAEVPFFDRSIVAVRLPDGRIAAVLSVLCDVLKLNRPGQLQRIRHDDLLQEQLLLAQVQTEGGPQAMDVLTAWAIPTWLQGIKLGKVAPEKRAAILAFKREAADVLYRHFSQRQAQLAPPPNLVPSEPITQPEVPARDAGPDAWIRYHEGMIAWLQWQHDVETWRAQVNERLGELDELETRMESAEAVLQLVPEIIERLGPATLTPEHQRTVQNAAKRLHEIGGYAYATIYAELGEHFQIAKYDQIHEARWEEVAEWFRTRLDAAERRARRG